MMRPLLTTLLPATIALLALALTPAFAIDAHHLSNPRLQQRYVALMHEIRCVECQDENIYDSQADIAGQMRHELRTMLRAGKSDAQIKSFLVSRYGDFILFKPRFILRNAWLWLTPVVLLLAGIGIAWRIIHQRMALVAQDGDEPAEDDDPLGDPRPDGSLHGLHQGGRHA